MTYPLGFLYIVYTARYLGTEEFGVLSFALAFAAIFKILVDMGFDGLGVREIARDRELAGKYLGNVIPVKIVLGISCFALIVLSVKLLGYPEETARAVYLVSAGVLFTSFTEMFNAIFRAFERMGPISVGLVTNKVTLLSLTLLAISMGLGLEAISAIYLVASGLAFAYALFTCTRKYVLPAIEIDRVFLKETLKKSLPFFLSAAVNIIAFKIDMVMLSMLKGDAAVGYYSAAYRLIEALHVVPVSLAGSLYPVFSTFHVSSKEALNSAYEISFKLLLIAGLPIAIGTTLLADRIVPLMYGSEFAPSIPALKILIWTIPPIFLSYIIGTLFSSINRQVLSLKINTFTTALNIVANLLLIPGYGFLGAAFATVLTYTTSFTLGFYFTSRLTCKIPLTGFALKLLAANVGMALFVLSLPGANLILLIAGSAAVYLGVLNVFGVVSKKDYEMLFRREDEMQGPSMDAV